MHPMLDLSQVASSTYLTSHEVETGWEVVTPKLVARAGHILCDADVRCVAGTLGRAHQAHPGLFKKLISLSRITTLAARHKVFPRHIATMSARFDMVNGHVLATDTAVLARVVVTREDTLAANLELWHRTSDL